MNWYDITGKYHELTMSQDGQLQALPEEWQRELAAVWRLEADVNNGGYLQFLQNWGTESYIYASQALKKIGALQMAEIVDGCQALVDKHVDQHSRPQDEKKQLMPSAVIGIDGTVIKVPGSNLPSAVVDRIGQLSYEFMAYPDDVAELGWSYFKLFIDDDRSGRKR